jgi:hypothetical protein
MVRVKFFGVAVTVVVLAVSPGLGGQRASTGPTVYWALHNLDLAGTRFSPIDQINTTNVKSLTPR